MWAETDELDTLSSRLQPEQVHEYVLEEVPMPLMGLMHGALAKNLNLLYDFLTGKIFWKKQVKQIREIQSYFLEWVTV